MNLNEWAKEIHKNAVAHGWWDSNPDDAEIIALIHSEWSEALEEYRAGRPMVWYRCNGGIEQIDCEGHHGDPHDAMCISSHGRSSDKCMHCMNPEGIAVELIDGCIRVLDYLAHEGIMLNEGDCMDEAEKAFAGDFVGSEVAKLVADLHWLTTCAYRSPFGFPNPTDSYTSTLFSIVIKAVFEWCKARGLDPEAIMRDKHEYNKTRPYKHGKVC